MSYKPKNRVSEASPSCPEDKPFGKPVGEPLSYRSISPQSSVSIYVLEGPNKANFLFFSFFLGAKKKIQRRLGRKKEKSQKSKIALGYNALVLTKIAVVPLVTAKEVIFHLF